MTEEDRVAAVLAEHILAVSGISVDPDDSFFASGLTSAMLVALHERLRPLFPRLLIAEMFKYSTRRSLARFLASASVAVPAPHGAQGVARADWSVPADSPAARRRLRGRLRQRDS